MLKIHRKLSVSSSIVLTAVMLIGVLVLAVYLPGFLEYLFRLTGPDGALLNPEVPWRTIVYIAGYAELALMLTGLGMLFALLTLVRKEKVFTHAAVELIRYISWCLILMGVILIALTFCSTLAMFVGVAIFFVGLTIRVVKNVIEAAVFLKEENDLMV